MKNTSSFLLAGVALAMANSPGIAGGVLGDIVRGAPVGQSI
jgi:hypothetical protein